MLIGVAPVAVFVALYAPTAHGLLLPLFVVVDALITTRADVRPSSGGVSEAYRPVLVLLIVFVWINWMVTATPHAVSCRYRRGFRGFLREAGRAWSPA